MSPKRRNMLVGLTVLGGLVGFSAMMLKFSGTAIGIFRQGQQIEVEFTSDRADGLADGALVLYRGVSVGRVTNVRRDDNARDIIIDTLIDNSPPLPANVIGVVRTQSLVSGISALSLELVGGAKAVPDGKLVDHQKIHADFVGSDLIPPEFSDLAVELEKTTQQVRDAQLVLHLDEDIRAAGEVLKGFHNYVDDPVIRSNLQVSLENFRHITESVQRSADNVEKFSGRLDKVADDATSTMADAHATVDHLSKQVDDRMLQISKSLDDFQSILGKVNNGQGTAGMLVNDPKLFQSLVENSRQLNATIMDLRRLVDQWEQEGISFKLK